MVILKSINVNACASSFCSTNFRSRAGVYPTFLVRSARRGFSLPRARPRPAAISTGSSEIARGAGAICWRTPAAASWPCARVASVASAVHSLLSVAWPGRPSPAFSASRRPSAAAARPSGCRSFPKLARRRRSSRPRPRPTLVTRRRPSWAAFLTAPRLLPISGQCTRRWRVRNAGFEQNC